MDRTERSRRAEPRGDNQAGSIRDLGDGDRPSFGMRGYTKILCSSQKGPKESEGVSCRNGLKMIRKLAGEVD